MSIKSLFEDIADAIREKSGSSDTYTPAEMPQAIANISGGGNLYTNYTYTTGSKAPYKCSTARTLLCTLGGREFYKSNNDLAYVCYAKQTYSNYTGPLLISTSAEGVKYEVGSNVFSAKGSFIRDGVTWFVSNDEWFMSGDLISTAGFCEKVSTLTGSSRILMGESFLDFISNFPDTPTTYDCFKPSQNGLILPPEGFNGFPALFIENAQILHNEHKTTTTGAMDLTASIAIPSTGSYIINAGGYVDTLTVKINNVAQPLTYERSLHYVRFYLETKMLNAGDVLYISAVGSGNTCALISVVKEV